MLELRDESICGKYQFYKDALSGKYGIRDWKIDRVILRPVFDKIITFEFVEQLTN